jgi:cytochrome c oxidase cbb3-type subunit 3
MRTTLILLAALMTAVGATGCQQQQQNVAAAALPASFVPIGPTPGFEKPPQVQSNPYANDSFAMTQGRKLFLWYNCAGCHGGHGGGGMGPSLRDQTWIYGSTDANVFDSIAQGRGKGMPAWGLKVPEQQIWQLVAYIKSMRSPQEPEPPE